MKRGFDIGQDRLNRNKREISYNNEAHREAYFSAATDRLNN